MAQPPVRFGDENAMPTYRRLLGTRLYAHCGIRAAVALSIIGASLFAHHVVGIELERAALAYLALFIALYNIAPWYLSRPLRGRSVTPPEYDRVVALAHGTIVLDYFALTCGIWLMGGCRSPLVAFYLLHVIVSAILLSRRSVLTLTALAYTLLVLLVLVEWTGWAPPPLPAYAIAGPGPLAGRFAVTLLAVHAMLFGLACFLLLELSRWLRSGERRIQIANAELIRLSEQRRDFLHVAMHNLKAPLGAVTMHLQNMLDGLAGATTDTQQEWLQRCLERLGGQTRFLSEMQELAALEQTVASESFQHVELAGVLKDLVQEYADDARERGLELRLELERHVPPVVGNERLLREALVNYVTNALKYTPRNGHIVVRLRFVDPSVRVEVCDDGPGIAREDHGRVFDEFVRVNESQAGSAKVKGTGLGLSIVKRIIVTHAGRVGVEDRAGGGCVFFVELPPVEE